MGELRNTLLRSSFSVPVDPPLSTFTNAVSSQLARAEPSHDQMMDTMKRAMADLGPQIHGACIGSWFGHDIYVNPAIPPGEIACVDPVTNEVRMRVVLDHPLMRGTKMGNAAREALGLPPLPPATSPLP